MPYLRVILPEHGHQTHPQCATPSFVERSGCTRFLLPTCPAVLVNYLDPEVMDKSDIVREWVNYETSSLGGTAGAQKPASPYEAPWGCWRREGACCGAREGNENSCCGAGKSSGEAEPKHCVFGCCTNAGFLCLGYKPGHRGCACCGVNEDAMAPGAS